MSEQAPETPAPGATLESVHARLDALEQKLGTLLGKAEAFEQAVKPVLENPHQLLARLFKGRGG